MTMLKDRPTIEQEPEREVTLEVQHEMLNHPGKWVAITSTRFVAAATSPSEALRRAHEAGVQHPILSHVPEQGTTYFF